jgi:hypothetical protein
MHLHPAQVDAAAAGSCNVHHLGDPAASGERQEDGTILLLRGPAVVQACTRHPSGVPAAIQRSYRCTAAADHLIVHTPLLTGLQHASRGSLVLGGGHDRRILLH